jgi:predicted histone-like DNA-binding protein
MTLNFKKEKPTVYRIQQVNYGVMDTKTLVDDVAESCGLNRAITKAVLEALVQRTCRYIGMGHAVQLGDLGTIKPVFNAKTQKTVEELSADNIRTKKVRFFPGMRLREVVKNISISEYDLADGTILDSEEETDTETPDTGGDEQGGTEMD